MWRAMKRAWIALVTRPYAGGRCNTATSPVMNGGYRSFGAVASSGGGGQIATSAASLSCAIQTSVVDSEKDRCLDGNFTSILRRRIECLYSKRAECLLHTSGSASPSAPHTVNEDSSQGSLLVPADVTAFLRSHETVILGDITRSGPTVVVPYQSGNVKQRPFTASLRELLLLKDSDKNVDNPTTCESGLSSKPPPTYRLLFHGSSNALSILTNQSPHGLGFQVPPPPSVEDTCTTTRPDTCYEGVYLTPSYSTALSYAGLTNTDSSAKGGTTSNAGVLVCAVRLGRIYNEFLEGPDAALERQLAEVVRRRKQLDKDGGSTDDSESYDGVREGPSNLLRDVQFDTRMSWLDETAVYCVVDPLRVLPILCIRPQYL